MFSGLSAGVIMSERAVEVVVSRQREWWLGKEGKNDTLEISETGQPTVDVLTPLKSGSCNNSPTPGSFLASISFTRTLGKLLA